MTPRPFIFDAPVQRLRAGDRILRSPEPELADGTVIYVRSAVGAAPVAFRPVSVVLTHPRIEAAGIYGTAAPVAAWGTRTIIERIPEPEEPYHVSAREPLAPDTRLEIQVLSALTLDREEWWAEYETPGEDPPSAGAIIAALARGGGIDGSNPSDAAADRGEVIEAWWYVDGHRVETPHEQSGREAADLFADHTVRLHEAGKDAGETCPACGRVVSWADHLPPARPGDFVRCTARTPRAVA